MTDPANDPKDAQLEADFYTSPLQEMAVEVHEIYEELKAAGFAEREGLQIVAHMISDAVFYRGEEVDEDDDDEDEDNDTDERLG